MADSPTFTLGTWVTITDDGSLGSHEWYCATHDHTVVLAPDALARVSSMDTIDPDEYAELLVLDAASAAHRLPNMSRDWFTPAAPPSNPDEEVRWCLATLTQ